MISKHLICALLLSLSFAFKAPAQEPTATPQTDEQRQAQQALEHKALNLLDEVIKEADSFKQPENRIRIKMVAASILWKSDETRARAIFHEAMAALIDLLNEPSNADATAARKMFEGPRELRNEMLQILAKVDGRMARELLHATRSMNTKAALINGLIQNPELQMDLNLAVEVAPTDPKLAAEIAEESLAKGFSYQLTNIISAMRAKDADEAARLANDVLAKLRTEKLESNSDARRVALDLLRLAATNDSNDQNSAKNVTPLLDESALRELAGLVAKEALRSPQQNMDMRYSLQGMMPVIEKYAPSQAEAIRRNAPRRVAEDEPAEELSGAEVAKWQKYSQLMEKGSADDLLSAASDAPPEVSESLYQSAIAKMIGEGQTDHARQVINEKIQDPARRKQLLSELDQAAAVAAAEQGKIEQARKALATLRTDEERMMLLAQLATGAAAKGEKKIALQLLDEARGMVSQRAKNIKQLAAQLMVARAYIRLDPARSFEMLEPIADQLNELLGAAIMLGGFFIEELVTDDEITLSSFAMLLNLSANNSGGEYIGDLVALAHADFDRTKALVDRFQRFEARIMLRLLLAQTILSPPPNPTDDKGSDRTKGTVFIGVPVGGMRGPR